MQVAVLKEPADEDISPFRIDRENPLEHRLVPAETPITIQHLLTHTSGLAGGGLGSLVSGQGAERDTLANYIPTLGDMALDFQPGSRWTYSGGTGLDVVARIIEIVSGMPYDEFVQTRIFDPLETDPAENSPASSCCCNRTGRRVRLRKRRAASDHRLTNAGCLDLVGQSWREMETLAAARLRLLVARRSNATPPRSLRIRV